MSSDRNPLQESESMELATLNCEDIDLSKMTLSAPLVKMRKVSFHRMIVDILLRSEVKLNLPMTSNLVITPNMLTTSEFLSRFSSQYPMSLAMFIRAISSGDQLQYVTLWDSSPTVETLLQTSNPSRYNCNTSLWLLRESDQRSSPCTRFAPYKACAIFSQLYLFFSML